MSAFFLIRTPVREVAGMAYGGPLRMRIGHQAAYAGFRDAALAAEVADFWGIESDHLIEPWAEALCHEVPGARVRRVLVFDTRADFDRYLRQGAAYDFGPHLIDLHPAMLGLQDRRRDPGRTAGTH